MLRVRISELEKEVAQMHEHEAQMLAERDSILMAAHEKADDILEQTMQRVQKSESQIRQNRIIASCCITDARRRISDLLIEVSKRLVIEDGNVLDAEQITPEAVEDAEREEKLAEADFARLVDDPAAEQPSDAEKPEERGPKKLCAARSGRHRVRQRACRAECRACRGNRAERRSARKRVNRKAAALMMGRRLFHALEGDNTQENYTNLLGKVRLSIDKP